MLLHLPEGAPERHMVQVVKGDFSVVVGRLCGVLLDIEFFEFVLNNLINVELDGPLYRLSKRLCPDLPSGREPASGAFHAHTELGKARAIGRNYGRAKCSGKCAL